MASNELQTHLRKKLGKDIVSLQRVSGGSINQAARLTLADGRICFLKWNHTADPRMFAVERKGLSLLAGADTDLRVPEVLATGQTESGTGFLVQEYINEGKGVPRSARQFGRELAELHQHHDRQYGLDHDNYIGKLPQSNTRHDSWTRFFIEERMEPQLRMATDEGKLDSTTVSHFESMFTKLPDIFPEEPPSLIHGDLWGGNFFYDEAGTPTIYDPAVYYGHREIELAFTRLFGGFAGDFYSSYEEHYPIVDGFMQRKDIYNLYPLLVHTNLFGGSYARQVQSIVRKF